MIWYNVRYDMVCYVRYDMNDMIWYGIWYDIWYDILFYIIILYYNCL